MKFESDIAYSVDSVTFRFCSQPELNCIWCLTREELVIAEELSDRATQHIPLFKGHICNCNTDIPNAIDIARQVGCEYN